MEYPKKEYLLNDPPEDGISRVFFSKGNKDVLIVSSWDKSVSIYNVRSNRKLANYFHNGPVLDCAISYNGNCFSGGLCKKLQGFDVTKQFVFEVGNHKQPIRCVSLNEVSSGCLVTGSWDASVKIWDHKNHKIVKTIETSGKVFSMDFTQDGCYLLVGCENRKVQVIDMRKFTILQNRTSPLLHQTRCVRTFQDGKSFAISSVEGRVGIEYFDSDVNVQKKRYAFKCHRKKINDTTTLYPVNDICVYKDGTFLTGGCDGKVISWDSVKRKRIKVFETNYPTSIASLSFNFSRELVAIASSYTFEMGDREHPKDQVFLRPIKNEDVTYMKKKE